MCPWTSKIEAFHDGELSEIDSARVASHVRECVSCSRHLDELNDLSHRLLVEMKSIAPGDIAMHRWRTSVRETGLGSMLRLVRFVAGIAAAIMVGGGVWHYTHQVQPAGASTAITDGWEQIAVLPPVDTVNTAPVNGTTAEVELAEWIVTDLSNASVER
jgi:anti-sigma factor RsiW